MRYHDEYTPPPAPLLVPSSTVRHMTTGCCITCYHIIYVVICCFAVSRHAQWLAQYEFVIGLFDRAV